MSNLLLLAVCFIAGVLISRQKGLPVDAHRVVIGLVINVTLPAVALLYIHKIVWNLDLAVAIAMPWATFCLSAVVFYFIGKSYNWSKPKIGAVTLVAGVGSTSFIGAPIVEALHGRDSLPLVMALDLAGTDLILCTFGALLAIYYGGGTMSLRSMSRQMVSYPPFVAMLVALCLIPLEYPPQMTAILQRLADMTTPLVLMAIGMQVCLKNLNTHRSVTTIALGFKLLVCPILVTLAFMASGTPVAGNEYVVIIASAMGPSASIIALSHQYNLDSKLTTAVVGIGAPLSILSAPMVNFFATRLV